MIADLEPQTQNAKQQAGLTYQYSVIVPVYNSAETLSRLDEEISAVFKKLNLTCEIVFVDDCSSDDSWKILNEIKAGQSHIRIIRLSNNFGQAAATLCGIHRSRGEMIITIDDDMQYPPREIEKMIHHFNTHAQLVVFGIGEKRKHSLLHRIISGFVGWTLNTFVMTSYKGVKYVSSFRIFRRRLLFENENEQSKIRSLHVFAQNISSQFVGHVMVDHEQSRKRKSAYSFSRRINGFVPVLMIFSEFPLRYFFRFGMLALLVSFIFLLLDFFYLTDDFQVANIFLILSTMISACILISLAILSRYLSKLYLMRIGKPEYFIIEEK